MIFIALMSHAERGELILIDGGMCTYRLRRDKQITISEIISLKPGAGSIMLEQLKQVEGAESIFAKCPAHLESNAWYAKKGFVLEGSETTKRGTVVNHWRLTLASQEG